MLGGFTVIDFLNVAYYASGLSKKEPCHMRSSRPNTIGDAKNSAYATTSGGWRGQVQFMAKAGTAVVSEAHAQTLNKSDQLLPTGRSIRFRRLRPVTYALRPLVAQNANDRSGRGV